MALTLTALRNFPLIRRDDNLADIVVNATILNDLQIVDNDIFVFAQKIISKAEGRMVNLNTVHPTQKAQSLSQQTEKDPRLIELILSESNEVLRVREGVIIVEHKLGFICANAGIDHSNVENNSSEKNDNGDDYVLLLPMNPDLSAQKIQEQIESRIQKKIGILIIDSHGRAWRNGTAGVSIGMAGIPGLEDLRGTPDLFGNILRITQVGVADELAAAASLVMGQAAEGTPVVHVRGFPYPLRDGKLQELIRPKDQDLFR